MEEFVLFLPRPPLHCVEQRGSLGQVRQVRDRRDGAVLGEDRVEQGDGGESSEEHVERIVDLSAWNSRMWNGGTKMSTVVQQLAGGWRN